MTSYNLRLCCLAVYSVHPRSIGTQSTTRTQGSKVTFAFFVRSVGGYICRTSPSSSCSVAVSVLGGGVSPVARFALQASLRRTRHSPPATPSRNSAELRSARRTNDLPSPLGNRISLAQVAGGTARRTAEGRRRCRRIIKKEAAAGRRQPYARHRFLIDRLTMSLPKRPFRLVGLIK